VRASRHIPDHPVRAPLLVVLGASPAIPMFAHLVGYLEQLGYAALLLAVSLSRRPWAQFAIVLTTASLAPFIHEASVFWFGSLSILIVVTLVAGQWPVRRWLIAACVVALAWVASTTAVVVFGLVSPERARDIRIERSTFSTFSPRQDAYGTLSTTARDSFERMMEIWREPVAQEEMTAMVAAFGPCVVLLTVVSLRLVRALDEPWTKRLLLATLVVTSVLSPLLLHLIAWDRYRWNALATFNAGVACLVVCRAGAGSRVRAPRVSLAVALSIAAWSVSTDLYFFDEYTPNRPPFVRQIQFVIEAIKTRDATLWIPEW
jgi:hypothetical protein